ncbi:hypothetical protein D2M30_2123 [Bacillus amyloliquefaciens]|nr:hypothetical protein D2M30_2123 [Bacillus amyloliquefaciens]
MRKDLLACTTFSPIYHSPEPIEKTEAFFTSVPQFQSSSSSSSIIHFSNK